MSQDTQRIHVDLAERGYDVIVGSGTLGSLGEALSGLVPDDAACAVITDSNVGRLYAEALSDSLRAAGYRPTTVEVPAGEPSKSMAVTEDVCRQMIQAGLDRKAFAVALGGGVVGDLAGFAASVFYRGIPFIQIPTTIVAQVDSSVGGKTGVNAPEGKNLIGAFHQPRLVLIDTETLRSLPDREFREGFAEVIKHAAIRDADMLPAIEAAATVDDRATLIDLVARNVAIKARVVEEDERETSGTRALLNFGHTIGHAIESCAGYGQLLHGEAISIGTHAALTITSQITGLAESECDRIRRCLDLFGLPRTIPDGITDADIIETMGRDKKFSDGAIRFVVLDAIGAAHVSKDVTKEHIAEAIAAIRA